ncbi:hypothetical protein NDU88_002268 [Pleurodeles waltl]|uniref:Uncharacterized protein n=1 Tax=Pleurodeles waltl TaxID=8319 RepID=A0AAV7NEY4_PLEWA|nr:hypothetical protein NDU88_002268 [Pleurodeles waltl]
MVISSSPGKTAPRERSSNKPSLWDNPRHPWLGRERVLSRGVGANGNQLLTGKNRSTLIAASGSAWREKGGRGEQSLVQRRLLLPGAPTLSVAPVSLEVRGAQRPWAAGTLPPVRGVTVGVAVQCTRTRLRWRWRGGKGSDRKTGSSQPGSNSVAQQLSVHPYR